MNRNPFIFGKPVKKEDFCNRKDEIEQAIGFLKKLQCFSIVGERRIGKTSFLEHILSIEIIREHGIDPEKYIVADFDLSGFHEISKESLIGAIVEKIVDQTQIEIDSMNVFEKLKMCIEKLASDDKNIIIAFDEFERIVPILDDHFSQWLRFIFQRSNVTAITASKTTARELEAPGDAASPLFNIFGNVFLGLFTREETKNMIIEMFYKGRIGLWEEEISLLTDLSGGHPYFIQFLGYYYYEEKVKDREIIPGKFKDRMFHLAKDQFESYWKHLSKGEKKFLCHLGNSEDDYCGSILERKGFIFKKEDVWKVFSPLFQEFINIRSKTDQDLVFGD